MMRVMALLAYTLLAASAADLDTLEIRPSSAAFSEWLGVAPDALGQMPFRELRSTALARLAHTLATVVPADVLEDLAPELAPAQLSTQEAVDDSLGEMLRGALQRAESLGLSSWEQLATEAASGSVASEFPYFGFIPRVEAKLSPAATKSAVWESRCWKTNSAELTVNTAKTEYSLKISVSGHKGSILPLACTDYYMITTMAAFHVGYFPTPVPGSKTFRFSTKGLSAAELWDLRTNGIRALRFRDNLHELVADVTKTVALFDPLAMTRKCCRAPSEKQTAVNLDFLSKYVNYTLPPRSQTAPPIVPIDESAVASGDMFGILRLDGLDPMLAWGMGSTTGHTTMAMRDPADGVLYVHESQVNSSYWPANGVQRTPFSTWIKQAETAGYQIIWAPLSAAARKTFNATESLAFFRTQEHLDYGFGTLLAGWVDTPADNYPCLPPYPALRGGKDSWCLTWDIVEILFPLGARLGKWTVEQVYLESWNHRVGVKATAPLCEGCLDTVAVVQKAVSMGIAPSGLWPIPEQDSWQYSQQYNNGTRVMGAAMVCDVFVCRMWKAGGLFDGVEGGRDAVNCGELTNWDVYALNVLAAPDTLPEACSTADPGTKLCQLTGLHQMYLNDFATKAAYAHMGEKCPQTGPLPMHRPAGC